jgi:hypothetical protein
MRYALETSSVSAVRFDQRLSWSIYAQLVNVLAGLESRDLITPSFSAICASPSGTIPEGFFVWSTDHARSRPRYC